MLKEKMWEKKMLKKPPCNIGQTPPPEAFVTHGNAHCA